MRISLKVLSSLVCVALATSASTGIATPPQGPVPTPFYATPFERKPDVQTLTDLGRTLFFDRALSASGRMACASCHDPGHAWGPPNALAVQLGGANLRTPGLRAVPSLTYRQDTPPFNEHFSETDGNDAIDQGPTGGRAWDGRANTAHEQATLPLLSPFEMANTDRHAALERLRRSASAERFRATFGPHALDQDDVAWNGVLLALEVFQQNPADFYPYTSKYDAFLRGRVKLSPAEQRGLALFNNPEKGNCAACHPSAIKHGGFPSFTDHGLLAIGVPRNRHIPANADPAFYDLGLCGPLRTDLQRDPDACGRFKTPPLRNVAVRSVFFHNGVFHSLEEVVRFYALRDVDPARYYGRDASGHPRRFNDLPASYRSNVNVEPPFGSRREGKAVLSEDDIRDVVAFLKTLTDGYAPAPGQR